MQRSIKSIVLTGCLPSVQFSSILLLSPTGPCGAGYTEPEYLRETLKFQFSLTSRSLWPCLQISRNWMWMYVPVLAAAGVNQITESGGKIYSQAWATAQCPGPAWCSAVYSVLLSPVHRLPHKHTRLSLLLGILLYTHNLVNMSFMRFFDWTNFKSIL